MDISVSVRVSVTAELELVSMGWLGDGVMGLLVSYLTFISCITSSC